MSWYNHLRMWRKPSKQRQDSDRRILGRQDVQHVGYLPPVQRLPSDQQSDSRIQSTELLACPPPWLQELFVVGRGGAKFRDETKCVQFRNETSFHGHLLPKLPWLLRIQHDEIFRIPRRARNPPNRRLPCLRDRRRRVHHPKPRQRLLRQKISHH